MLDKEHPITIIEQPTHSYYFPIRPSCTSRNRSNLIRAWAFLCFFSREIENQMKCMTEEIEMLTEQNNQLMLQNTRTENEIKELENQNDDLQLKLENQQFDIEFQVREEMSSKIQEKLGKNRKNLGPPQETL